MDLPLKRKGKKISVEISREPRLSEARLKAIVKNGLWPRGQ
jgi:hypothetical protein